MFGARLAEVGQILGDGEVTGHSNFLATTDSHAVDPADDGFVAAENAGNHVVEQAHVLPVFLRVTRVILGVFLGVSAGAKCPVAGSGEYDADNVTCI